MISTLMRRV